MRAPILLALAQGLFSASAFAASVVETTDRLEVNWSTLRVRFYGEATTGATDIAGDGLKSAEKRAWHDGLSYVSDAVRNLNISANEGYVASPEKLTEYAREAASQVSKATSSYNTTYFADGTVRVHLESVLPKALEAAGLRFRQKEALAPAMTQFTGVVLKTDKTVKPRALYQVVDETGAVLYDVHDMAEEAYKRNLMGRWFKRPSSGELAEAVGKNPLTLEAKALDGGKFQVRRDSWEKALEGHKALLVNGTVAVALP